MTRLSICIATRNRAAFLASTLDTLIPDHGEPVEIVIVDGASTDDTPAVVERAKARFPGIRYRRQEVNGGVDRDFDAAVGLASGDYCWLMSDDDHAKPGAIARILAALQDDPSLVVVNGELRSPDFSEVLDPNRLGFSDPRTYGSDDHERLFVDAAYFLTFIGGVVIRRDVWLARAREPYFGSGFIHLGVIFQAPLPSRARTINEPQIEIRHGNISWSARAFTIWMFDLPRLIWSLPPIPDRARKKVTAREPWRSVRNLLVFRCLGAYKRSEYERLILPAKPSLWTRAIAFAVAVFPGVPLNLAAVLYCLATRSRVELYSLMTSPYYLPRLLGKREHD